jgi:phage-related protein
VKEYVVQYHSRAVRDLGEIRDRGEKRAIYTVVDKLSRIGQKLTGPHCAYVQGKRGLYELRPRSGRSRWRPLYVAVDELHFTVLVIAPEARIDPSGFKAAVERACALAEDGYSITV